MLAPKEVGDLYLRPGNLFKDFRVEKKEIAINFRGRPKGGYEESGDFLKAVLAKASPEEKERWKQMQHPISHTVVQKGSPKANPEDRLILGNRVFLIQGLDELGSLGLWTIYYVEERFDVRGY